ncbi:MAG: ribonuclease Z [Polyangiaceae bacterium]
MSLREWLALGTASQVPTRQRNHNGHFLRWDDEGFLFDPGEGSQRQMAYADLASSSIHRIFVTHFHGDHCLGLAGIIQRLSLDRCAHPVTVHYPSSGQQYFERLRYSSIYFPAVDLVPSPIDERQEGLFVVVESESYRILGHKLEHGVPTIGYRLEERSGRRFLPEKLAELGVKGPLVGELSKQGYVEIAGRRITVEDVSVPKEGSVVAFVMDTKICPGAFALAKDADLLVMEATYSAADQQLATDHGHCSSVDAATVAKECGVKQLALTHFSQRYLSSDQHVDEARAIFPKTVALKDLARVTIPRRK